MHLSPFSKIRKSSTLATLIAGLLSNIIVFAQPVEQIIQQNNQLSAFGSSRTLVLRQTTESSLNPLLNHNPLDHNRLIVEDERRTNNKVSTGGKETSVVKETLVYQALEEEAMIGVVSATDKENPRDNFFTFTLPQTF